MFGGPKTNGVKKRRGFHPAFHDICKSCSAELKEKGYENEVYLLTGGVGIKLLNNTHPSLAHIAHLPIIEFDFDYPGEPLLEHLSFFRLQGLRFSQSKLKAFSQLEQFSLMKLHLDGVSATDFNSLSGHPLKELSLRKTEVQSLEFLHSCEIEIIYLSSTRIDEKSLEVLQGKPLEKIDLFKCKISDLSSLADSPLEELVISGTSVQSLEALRSCPLRKIEMRATQISDLSPLSNCPLEVLHLPGSPVTSLSPISNCPITELNIVGLKVNDLSPLLSMPLKKLAISKSNLTEEQGMILKQLPLQTLFAPGEPENQTPDEFFNNWTES
ncbi:MAG: hypothetical protein P8P49_12445 [Opitutales bacterium]|nr:hypothetical protein [Opitutales bacterium]